MKPWETGGSTGGSAEEVILVVAERQRMGVVAVARRRMSCIDVLTGVDRQEIRAVGIWRSILIAKESSDDALRGLTAAARLGGNSGTRRTMKSNKDEVLSAAVSTPLAFLLTPSFAELTKIPKITKPLEKARPSIKSFRRSR
jgi:hypothetical protein